jgi:[acyl-carrier-protein] S-malonyltransferase
VTLRDERSWQGAGELGLVFPGQGSHEPGMRERVERYRPELIELARAEIGELPFARAEDATEFAQPAIYCADLAAYSEWALGDYEPPAALAGHSLGELPALVAAGAIAADDGLRLVAKRAELMHQCCLEEPGGMIAVLGKGAETAPELADRFDLTVANDNCPGQMALSGPIECIDALLDSTPERPDVHLKRLPVAGAFHSEAMRPAVSPFRRALEEVEIRPMSVPVISGMTAKPFEDVRRELSLALIAPVRWREVVLELRRRGAARFIEIGPGHVLSGLVKRTLRAESQEAVGV